MGEERTHSHPHPHPDGGTGFNSGVLATESGNTPLVFTQYNYTYVAATTAPILTFAFVTDLGNSYFLDTVSVTKVTAPSVELLQNLSFENSTTQLNGWVLWCNSTCSPGAGGQVTYGTNCYLATGNCFLADCPGAGNGGAMVFLGQSFSATVVDTYTISFRLHMGYGNGL
jgi:hypothetical protein